jgi:hypothetical protein
MLAYNPFGDDRRRFGEAALMLDAEAQFRCTGMPANPRP